jgi:hypothetical protein
MERIIYEESQSDLYGSQTCRSNDSSAKGVKNYFLLRAPKMHSLLKYVTKKKLPPMPTSHIAQLMWGMCSAGLCPPREFPELLDLPWVRTLLHYSEK